MTEEVSGKLAINTTDFRASIAAANLQIRLLESGFRAASAGLVDWTKDATGLEARAKSLTGQIEQQKIKVASLEAEYRNMVAEGKTSQRGLAEQEIQINKASEVLGKMQTELEKTNTSIGDLGSSSQDAGQKVADLGDK